MQKAFLEKGWHENRDRESLCFDIKWVCKQKDIDFKNMIDGQIVNHFQFNWELTTKSGLCRNMQNVRWVADVDPDTFFPKCFNLTDDDMFEEFIEQFKLIKAETILKKYLKNIETNKK